MTVEKKKESVPSSFAIWSAMITVYIIWGSTFLAICRRSLAWTPSGCGTAHPSNHNRCNHCRGIGSFDNDKPTLIHQIEIKHTRIQISF